MLDKKAEKSRCVYQNALKYLEYTWPPGTGTSMWARNRGSASAEVDSEEARDSDRELSTCAGEEQDGDCQTEEELLEEGAMLDSDEQEREWEDDEHEEEEEGQEEEQDDDDDVSDDGGNLFFR